MNATPHRRHEGFAAVPNHLVRDETITPHAKVVLLVLASHAGAGGECWLSHATLAAEAGLSRTTVQTALGLLRDRGLVAWENRRRADGGQGSNVYVLDLFATPAPGPQDEHPLPVTRVPPTRHTGTPYPSHGHLEEEPLEEEPEKNAPRGAVGAATHDPTAQTLIGEWIDHCGTRPPGRVIGHVSREVKAMLDEGVPYGAIRAGMARWHGLRLNPGALASVVHEVMQGPATTSRSARPTTDDRVRGGVDLARQLAALEGAPIPQIGA